jgi:hypothetical protein
MGQKDGESDWQEVKSWANERDTSIVEVQYARLDGQCDE